MASNTAYNEKKSLGTASVGDRSDLAMIAMKQTNLKTMLGNEEKSSEGILTSYSALGEQAIKAVSMLKRNFNRDDSADAQSRATKVRQQSSNLSQNPLSDMINKWFTDVERFRNKLGGSKELTSFIKKLSEEGGTGEIYAKENKRKN